jgi:uncharacterized Zn-finger protein
LRHCNCEQRPAATSLYDFPEAWVNSLQVLAKTPQGRRRLLRCPYCGQRWQLDPDPKNYSPSSALRGAPRDKWPCLALKVPSDTDWDHFDERPARIAYLIESRGGISSERCRWRDCTKLALHESAYCPEHTYDGVP